MAEYRSVVLRKMKIDGTWNQYLLRASINEDNDLVIEGQDFSSLSEDIFGDEEYEYSITINCKDLPFLRQVLKIGDSEDLLDFLEANYSGEKSFEFERLLQNSRVPYNYFTR